MRGLYLTAVLLSFAASPAFCDGPISTAPSAAVGPSLPVGVAPGPLDADSYDDADVQAPSTSCGPARTAANGAPDTSVHGEVDVGVGTSGYRHLGVRACKPLPDGGAVAISVETSQSQWGGHRR